MTVNELLAGGARLRSVYEVVRIIGPDEGHPFGREQLVWRSGDGPVDLLRTVAHEWADLEIVSIWPMHDEGFPFLQIEVA